MRTFAELAVANGCGSRERLSGILEFPECFELYHLQMSNGITLQRHQHYDHILSRNAHAQQLRTAAMHAPRDGGTLHSPSQLTPVIQSLCRSPAIIFIIFGLILLHSNARTLWGTQTSGGPPRVRLL